MNLQKRTFILSICLISLIICSACAEVLIKEDTGSFTPDPPISLDDPNPDQHLILPGSEDPPSPGDRNTSPDERFSYIGPGYQPEHPDPANNPDIRETPAPVLWIPSPDERISYPDPSYREPYQDRRDPPFIPPTPTPQFYDPVPMRELNPQVMYPGGNIYPVYEDRSPRYRYQSSFSNRNLYYESYNSPDWYRTGAIQIISTPMRAEVYLNNKYRGKTPYSGYLEISDLVPGTYELRVQYSGYIPYSHIVQVERNEVETINVVLTHIQEEITGESSIRINSEPSGASVLLDNEYRGITPVTLNNMVSGEHTVILQKTGYTDFVTRVQTVQGQIIPVTGVMMIVPPPPTAQPTVPPAPVQTPVPAATQAGLPDLLVIISLVAGILISMPVQKQ